MTITPPVAPVEPVLEDAEALGDQSHVWKLDEDGDVDLWVQDHGYHNGPGCSLCDFQFCHHCDPEDYQDLSCLRGQAEVRNTQAKWAYAAAVKKYEAQMEYYQALVGE